MSAETLPAVQTSAPSNAAEYVDEEDLAVRDGWHIEGLASADWALGRLRDIAAELREVEQLEQEAILRVKLRAEQLREKAERGLRFFEGRLQEYALTHRDELLKGAKKKSRELINGTIGWRKKAAGIEVVDEAALLAWAREQPVESGCLRIKEEPAIAAIKEHFQKTGEVPPGTDLQSEAESFYVKPNGGSTHGSEH